MYINYDCINHYQSVQQKGAAMEVHKCSPQEKNWRSKFFTCIIIVEY